MKADGVDIKKAFESGEEFVVYGLTFQPSDKDFKGEEKINFHAGIGVDDTFSKGYALEIDSDGSYRVYNFENSELVERLEDDWNFHTLMHLIHKYDQMTKTQVI
jgi:hypothetical protein